MPSTSASGLTQWRRSHPNTNRAPALAEKPEPEAVWSQCSPAPRTAAAALPARCVCRPPRVARRPAPAARPGAAAPVRSKGRVGAEHGVASQPGWQRMAASQGAHDERVGARMHGPPQGALLGPWTGRPAQRSKRLAARGGLGCTRMASAAAAVRQQQRGSRSRARLEPRQHDAAGAGDLSADVRVGEGLGDEDCGGHRGGGARSGSRQVLCGLVGGCVRT